MTPDELAALTDDQLMHRLDSSEEFNRTLKTEGWKLFEERCRRLFVAADNALDTVDPANYKKIAELQIMKRFYRHILPSIKNDFKQDAYMAFAHAKERGLIQRAMRFFSSTAV